MPATEREFFVQRAAAEGSADEVLEAVERAPIRMVSPGLVAQVRHQRIARADPELAKHIEQLSGIADAYTACLGTAREVLEAAGLPRAQSPYRVLGTPA